MAPKESRSFLGPLSTPLRAPPIFFLSLQAQISEEPEGTGSPEITSSQMVRFFKVNKIQENLHIQRRAICINYQARIQLVYDKKFSDWEFFRFRTPPAIPDVFTVLTKSSSIELLVDCGVNESEIGSVFIDDVQSEPRTILTGLKADSEIEFSIECRYKHNGVFTVRTDTVYKTFRTSKFIKTRFGFLFFNQKIFE